MRRYVLSRVAQGDLVEIRDYYLEQGGPRAARKMVVELVEAFRAIARMPGLGHRREDLAQERPLLFWPVRDFLVAYRPDVKPVEIMTVVHGFRDVAALVARMMPFP